MCLVLILSAGLSAQDFEMPASRETIASWLDYASYRIDNNLDFALVEFYYGLLRHDLTFEDLDSIYEATAYVWLEIFNENGVVIDTLYKKIGTRVDDPTKLSKTGFRILDALQALMKPGDYSVRLTVEDANSQVDGQPFTGKYAERQIKISVPDYSQQKLMVSDIELAYNITMLSKEDTLTGDPLDKSFRHVVPNPSGIFINTDSLMYFYAEIYNLKFGKTMNREYHVSYRIEDGLKNVIADYGSRQYFKPGSSAVVSSAIDVSDLPEGSFNFILEVKDAEDEAIARSQKPFELLYHTYELAPAVAEENFTQEDAEMMSKVIHYYANPTEKKQYESADLQGKKEVLKRFWSTRDPLPETRLNEFKEEVFRRFAYANQKYSVNLIDKSDGWKTDRGRIYMIYGEPDEIEYYPSSAELEPFERWSYYNHPRQGSIFFIFVDETGYGDYRLKHSNAKGEVTDYEWERRLEQADPFKSGF